MRRRTNTIPGRFNLQARTAIAGCTNELHVMLVRSRPRSRNQLASSACMTVLKVVGDLLANGCQIKQFLFDERIFSLFGKRPIHGCLLPKIFIPVHASSHLTRGAQGNMSVVRAHLIRIRPWVVGDGIGGVRSRATVLC
jgi:hypothetical protein